MNEPILQLEHLVEDARRAAQRRIDTGCDQPNPHLSGTDAAARWQTAYRRYVHSLSDPEAEGGC